MEYQLAIENTPESISGGTGVLLLHPSTGETDQIDTDFLKDDTDCFLIVSTRTTAKEVQQKLEYYGVEASRAVILDTISVERGYSRRSSENVYFIASPDDLVGITDRIESFLRENNGKRRISIDSVTELSYYAGEKETIAAVERILDLLVTFDAVGLFHLAGEVHESATLDKYNSLFDAIVELDETGDIHWRQE